MDTGKKKMLTLKKVDRERKKLNETILKRLKTLDADSRGTSIMWGVESVRRRGTQLLSCLEREIFLYWQLKILHALVTRYSKSENVRLKNHFSMLLPKLWLRGDDKQALDWLTERGRTEVMAKGGRDIATKKVRENVAKMQNWKMLLC